jgi:cupin 2 domain-containing protein
VTTSILPISKFFYPMPSVSPFSLFPSEPTDWTEEQIETMLDRPGVRIERILSKGHSTPEGQWYDQEDDEWVVLLKGAAQLEIEGQKDPIYLRPGEGVLLPAHCRHRVAWTDPEQTSLWLALHLKPV